MESSLSNLDLTEIERSAASPVPAATSEIQNPSEQERQLASKASLAYFNKKNYVEALAWLDNLVNLRPSDPRVTSNYALVNFLVEGGGFNDLAKFQADLKNVYSSIMSGTCWLLAYRYVRLECRPLIVIFILFYYDDFCRTSVGTLESHECFPF